MGASARWRCSASSGRASRRDSRDTDRGRRDRKQRVQLAARLFEALGTDVDVRRTADGWRLEGYGCPLSAVTVEHEEVCEVGKAMVEEVTGAPVTECCERGAHPRCAFAIAS